MCIQVPIDKLVNSLYDSSVEIGTYIREKRDFAGMSLRDFAKALQVDPAYLSRVEQGKVPPSEALLRQASQILGVDEDELLLLAGRVPETWHEAIATSPAWALETVRDALSRRVSEPQAPYYPTVLAFAGTRAIEDQSFPFEHLSDIAQLESWRKEVSRPIYHLHKWWAQRLGSVFRAILISAFAPKGSNILEMFYQPSRIPGAIIFDPFMGSGTTIGEALKLGARAIGRDINPVAHFAVSNALGEHPKQKVLDTFKAIEHDVASRIRHWYQARLPDGGYADVLYYFWVKFVPCPKCERQVDLFSSYIFSQHAYPKQNPEARVLCPHCGIINRASYDADAVTCTGCNEVSNPKAGPAKGSGATCPHCRHVFPIAKTIQNTCEPPKHRLYAKMVLRPDGTKDYLPVDDFDLALYEETSKALKTLKDAYPVVAIEAGYNTDQVLNYCYNHWHQMFNDRQLLCIYFLSERIRAIPDERMRELFTCLLSGTLEFNNMFASFKGEGTGAVRHMFSHHILKPERVPLEANPWGTPKSSGAFSTLFESRLLRALAYCERPFELRVTQRNGRMVGEKVYGLSRPLGMNIARNFSEFEQGELLYLSCGDSAKTEIKSGVVDAVVTDPPFFDNVHYSQLADFFHIWQRHILGENGHYIAASTRSPQEVQNSDPVEFTERLRCVWEECHRVLKPDGLLIFTYHHSRPEGWTCVLEALAKAGFVIVAAHPIKAEMSVAAPKHQAKDPIDLDIILVCRKRVAAQGDLPSFVNLIDDAVRDASNQVTRFNGCGRRLSRNDVRVVVTANVIKLFSWSPLVTDAISFLELRQGYIEQTIDSVHKGQEVQEYASRTTYGQLVLW